MFVNVNWFSSSLFNGLNHLFIKAYTHTHIFVSCLMNKSWQHGINQLFYLYKIRQDWWNLLDINNKYRKRRKKDRERERSANDDQRYRDMKHTKYCADVADTPPHEWHKWKILFFHLIRSITFVFWVVLLQLCAQTWPTSYSTNAK